MVVSNKKKESEASCRNQWTNLSCKANDEREKLWVRDENCRSSYHEDPVPLDML